MTKDMRAPAGWQHFYIRMQAAVPGPSLGAVPASMHSILRTVTTRSSQLPAALRARWRAAMGPLSERAPFLRVPDWLAVAWVPRAWSPLRYQPIVVLVETHERRES